MSSLLRILFFLLLSCSIDILHAQSPVVRVKSRSESLTYFEQLYKSQLETITEDRSNVKKYIKTQYENRWKDQKDMVERGEILYDSPLQKLCEDLLNEIVAANNLPTRFKIFVTEELIVNAYATGDGNLFITIGLLERLNHLDELKFVICHEISHDIKNHVNASIDLSAEMLFDKQVKKDYREALNSEYKVRTKLEKVIFSRLANARKFSRSLEFAADSVGKEFFIKSGGQAKYMKSLLEMLDHSDIEYRTDSINLHALVNLSGVPFNPSWYQQKSVSSLGLEKYDVEKTPDSLKTHPDIPLRIEKIAPEYALEQRTRNIDPAYASYQILAEREIIFSWFRLRNLGRAFYRAAMLEQTSPSAYTKAVMSLCASYLCIARREKLMGDYVSMEHVNFDPSYNKCLYFWNEMYSADMAKLASGWANNTGEGTDKIESEFVSFAQVMGLYVNKNKSDFEKAKASFLSKFPSGHFYTTVNSLNLNS
jgi:Zn-dependent protease with chaperone function